MQAGTCQSQMDRWPTAGPAPARCGKSVVAGKHLFEVRFGERNAKRDVDASPGTTVETDLRFEDAKGSVPAVTSAAAPSSSGDGVKDAVVEPPREEPGPSMATRNIVTGSLAVVGLTSVVVGAVFLSKAEGNISDAKSLAPGDPKFRSLGDEHSSNQTSGWIGVGVGAAFLAGAAVTFFVWPNTSPARASLRPVWLGTGAGLAGNF